MNEYLEHLQSSATSYFMGGVGLVSQANIMFVLGAAIMFVRFLYDVTRLVRYLRDPKHTAPSS